MAAFFPPPACFSSFVCLVSLKPSATPAVFLQTKPTCLCFFLWSLSQDREREKIKMPTFIQLLLCVGYNVGEARHQLFPRRPCCPYFQMRKLSPEPWHNLLIAGVGSWDLNLQLSDCLAQVFFPHCAWLLRRRTLKKYIYFSLFYFIYFVTFSCMHQHSTNPQTCISWYFQRCKASDPSQPFPANPENH